MLKSKRHTNQKRWLQYRYKILSLNTVRVCVSVCVPRFHLHLLVVISIENVLANCVNGAFENVPKIIHHINKRILYACKAIKFIITVRRLGFIYIYGQIFNNNHRPNENCVTNARQR